MSSTGAPLRVVTEEVKAVGRYAGDLAEQLKSGSMSLDRDVLELFGSWKGTAADAYRSGWEEMHDGALKAWDALIELAEKLGVTAEAYKAQDDATTAAVASVRTD
ncbi:WXG100 family type VII secretion target [Aldersonia kunmingensis]|uniref:WXG100 family type VII secretion target n=1 Tax=Aldersonia kunmingensis TaxID=408066 RepID=UPI000833F3BF|nr:WXG100 family type VII secretion target [Aldersonia kunmingensis]